MAVGSLKGLAVQGWSELAVASVPGHMGGKASVWSGGPIAARALAWLPHQMEGCRERMRRPAAVLGSPTVQRALAITANVRF
jgi:hypothetical protein